MMMTENLPPTSGGGASANGGGSNGKPRSSSSQNSADQPSAKGTHEPLKCPRCDSTQTKFCYYNNYSLTQPRHFCKTCRRYWTKGGALRNVPIGGGCRKNKKVRSSSAPSSASRILTAFHDSTELGNIASAGMGGLKFFHGLTAPAVDFQLGGLRFPGIQSTVPTGPSPVMYPQLPSFADISTNSCGYGPNLTAGLGGAGVSGAPCTTSSFLGLNNHPISTSTGAFKPTGETSSGGCSGVSSFLEMGSNNLATSIESLSSINQELHWKLQQHRLAMLYGQGQDEEEEPKEGREGNFGGNNNHHQIEKPQPILFQNLEISKRNDHHHRHQVIGGIGGSVTAAAAAADGKEGSTSNSTAVATEWFFDNPYASSSVGGRSGGVAHSATPGTGAANGEGCDNIESGTTNFIQAWSNGNHHQFNGLP